MEIKKATSQYEFFSLVQLRAAVFMCEQCVDPLIEIDEDDKTCEHYILIDNQQVIATCRIIKHDDSWHLGRIAVDQKYRQKGYGSKLILHIISLAKEHLIKKITLGAQLQALPFYQSLHFVPYGAIYEEANIQHQEMKMIL